MVDRQLVLPILGNGSSVVQAVKVVPMKTEETRAVEEMAVVSLLYSRILLRLMAVFIVMVRMVEMAVRVAVAAVEAVREEEQQEQAAQSLSRDMMSRWPALNFEQMEAQVGAVMLVKAAVVMVVMAV